MSPILIKQFRKPSKQFLIKFVLIFIIFFFLLTYTVINRHTIVKQIDIITEGSTFFAKTATHQILNLSEHKIEFDKQTYEIELLIFDEINNIRTESNLQPLKWDPKLSELARQHSLDMAKNNYINHTNLKQEDPTQRAENAGIKTTYETKTKIYTGISENIGFMPKGIVENVGVIITTEDIASATIYNWMLSVPHKENILEEEYFFTGIGVAYDEKENYYLTQNFQ